MPARTGHAAICLCDKTSTRATVAMTTEQSAKSLTVAWVGRVLGIVLALIVYWLPSAWLADMGPMAQATAAVTTLMAVWWMTEAVPLPVTSLLPLMLFPVLGVMSFDAAAAPFANKYVFLFMGGFMIARAVERWHLHRRIALLTVLAAGTQPTRLIGGFMVATAFLSMWISNTASTVMMLPIGLSLIALIGDRLQVDSQGDSSNFAICMMLGIAYSASIGGVATLVGTPTNVFLAGFAQQKEISIGFGQWMKFAAPLAAVLLVLTWLMLTRLVYPIRIRQIPGGRQLIKSELRKMGSVSRGEWTVLIVFSSTAAAWVLRGSLAEWSWLTERLPWIETVNDTQIALAAAFLLFLIPVDARHGVFALDWEMAKTIPWGVLLLFGGGFSLAKAVSESGLADWIGGHVALFAGAPPLAIIVAVTMMIVFLTELTSNTPTVAAFLPILYSVAEGIDMDPMLLMVPATVAASCAFMLPVATPPNAIVFGSGHISIRAMVKAGFLLNLLAIALTVAWMQLFGSVAFEIP